MCWKSKNLYNKVNDKLLHRFKEDDEEFDHRFQSLVRETKELEEKKVMGSNLAEGTLKMLSYNWKSFFEQIKDYKNNPDKYNGKPDLPKPLPSGDEGRMTVSTSSKKKERKDGKVKFPQPRDSKWDVYLEAYIAEGNKFQLRIVPQPKKARHVDKITHYKIEIVYEKEVKEINEREDRIAGIDLNKNNLAVIGTNKKIKPIMINGKPLLSMGNYYLKKRKKLMSYVGDRGASNRIRKLDKKYKNKVEDYLHKASRYIVDWCLEKDIDTIVIGKNKGLKQEINIGKRNNFHFTIVPHATLIEQIKYKANDEGIKVKVTEESYTSKCSFLDGDELPDKYDGKDREWSGRRIKRGLYKASDGTLINADLNGAYNIIRKVYPDKIDNTNVYKHPKKINL